MKLKVFIALIIIFLPLLASAQDLPDTGFKDICSKGVGLGVCIQKLYLLSLGLAAILALLMIVIAGYRYMTAAGNAQAVQGAKDAFASAFIGLLIIFIAFILLYLINPDLTKFRDLKQILPLPVIKPPVAIVQAEAKSLAQQILDNSSRITLANSHASGVSDNATARQNIIDTSQGRSAKLSNYGNASGGEVALSAKMLGAMMQLSRQFQFNVSEIAGASHSQNSFHYLGMAFDVNIINGQHVSASDPNFRNFLSACASLGAIEKLGPGDSGHDDHVHCAF